MTIEVEGQVSRDVNQCELQVKQEGTIQTAAQLKVELSCYVEHY